MSLRKRLEIDGYRYFSSSSSELTTKVFEEEVTVNGKRRVTERGFEPRQFEYIVICIGVNELHTLSGSFIKETVRITTPQGESLDCYFETFGPWEELRVSSNIFRVPIRLLEVEK